MLLVIGFDDVTETRYQPCQWVILVVTYHVEQFVQGLDLGVVIRFTLRFAEQGAMYAQCIVA
nr:hypothetical protein [Halomonas socia]